MEMIKKWTPWFKQYGALILICTIAYVIYLNLWHATFLSWDDDTNISINPYYVHLKWWYVWMEPYYGMYIPIISTIWAGLYYLGTGDAWPFRLFNATIHVANVILVWHFLTALFRRFESKKMLEYSPMAVVFGTTLFALHPLQSATVSWISGGRDLMATFCGLIAVMLYFKETRRHYWLATFVFGMGLLCKPHIAGIPLAIMTFVLIFERQRLGKVMAHMVPWSMFVLAAFWITDKAQSEMVRVQVPIYRRPLVVLDTMGFYLNKLIWPVNLSADYGRTPGWVWDHMELTVPTLITLIVFGNLLIWGLRRDKLYRLSAIWWVLILPVLGITTFAFQRISTVADHYNYLPMIAMAAILGVVVTHHLRNQKVAWAVWVFAVVLSTNVTWNRVQTWQDDYTFFTDVVEQNPRSSVARINLTQAACLNGEIDRGLTLINKALELTPHEAPAIANKAYCLYQGRQFNELIQMQNSILNPDVQFSLEQNYVAASSFANTVAGGYLQKNELEKAWIYLCQALAIKPFDPSVQKNIEQVFQTFQKQGRQATCPGRIPWDKFASIHRDLLN